MFSFSVYEVKTMKRWFISDTHFYHQKVIEYSNRPFKDVQEMNATLIANWNSCVHIFDTVFFLGDFGFANTQLLTNICYQLNGHKVCIRGNHDTNASRMNEIGFNVVLESAFIKIGSHKVELIHFPSEEPLEHFRLHGHVHHRKPNKIVDNQLNMSVEVWDYTPVSEKTILSLLDKTYNEKQSR